MAQLLLSGSIRLNDGYYSSVSIHPKKNVAVRVNDSHYGGHLYHSVGKVDKDALVTTWGVPEKYNTGQSPSVALTEVKGQLCVIETHCSRAFQYCYYHVGKVIGLGDDLKIKWSKVNKIGFGFKPKVCAKNDGTVIIVKEMKNGFGIGYHIGRMSMSGESCDWNLDWQPEMESNCVQICDAFGVEPAIACNDNKIVLVYRSHLSTLKCMIANLDKDNISSWTMLETLKIGGNNPSISINCHGFVVESHQTTTLRRIYCSTGKITGDQIEWNPESLLVHTTGEYPSILG